MKSRIIDNSVLPLGNNEYEAGTITLAAGTEISIGVILKRNTDGGFSPVSDTGLATISADVDGTKTDIPIPGVPADIPVVVNPSYIKNEGTGAVTVGFRALVAGKVRRDKLTIAGVAITDAQADALRNYGIIPVAVNDVSRLDNM
ncbi:MAG: hypothetical protein LBJ31_04340 [Treponema sp.]|jgi:hypothetical protein|nr:hypothetical protein [Treponema sp.]